jgi:hypothetical protein
LVLSRSHWNFKPSHGRFARSKSCHVRCFISTDSPLFRLQKVFFQVSWLKRSKIAEATATWYFFCFPDIRTVTTGKFECRVMAVMISKGKDSIHIRPFY